MSVYAILFDCYTLFVASTAPGSSTEHVAYSDIDTKMAAADIKYMKTATGKVRVYKRKTQRGDYY